MSWCWEELTAAEFPQAVEATQGVCVLPIGVIEKHGEHLPLGTDTLAVRKVAELAAAREPALIFPWYYFGQIHEAKQWSGTIAIKHELYFPLLENVCEEIARNGLHKIIILNGHGGNESFLNFFARSMLQRPRDYSIYLVRLGDYMGPVLNDPRWQAMMETPFDEHGGEMESSLMLAVRPDLVHLEQAAPGVTPLGRLRHLPLFTGTFWYANYPDHYAGDAHPATREKGEFLLNGFAAQVAQLIAAVKADTTVPALEREFFARTQH